MSIIAQQVEPSGVAGVSTGVLGAILGGGLLGAVIAAYRFAVNYRTTERGMRAQAARDKRLAQYEAGMWQGRCADLEYLLKRNGIPVPKLIPELQRLVDMSNSEDVPLPKWDDPTGLDERLQP